MRTWKTLLTSVFLSSALIGSIEAAKIHADQGEVPAVELDNGKRWKANPETTQGINAMTAILDRHKAEPVALSKLKEQLEAEFQMIFQKCTMTGEAHNQLHNYLIPLHKMLQAMDGDTGEKEIAAMHDHLQSYPRYFE